MGVEEKQIIEPNIPVAGVISVAPDSHQQQQPVPSTMSLAEQQAALGPPPGATPIDPAVVLSIGQPGCVVEVHGLPPRISLEELCQFFTGHEVVEDSVRMHYNDLGEPTGDCLLAIATPEDTVRAVAKLNGAGVSGHTVRMYIVPLPPEFLIGTS